MNKILTTLMLLLFVTLQAQNEQRKEIPILEKNKIEIKESKKLTMDYYKVDNLIKTDTIKENNILQKGKPRSGTHVVVIACANPPYPNPASEDGRILTFTDFLNLAINTEVCPNVNMVGYSIFNQNGTIVQEENIQPVQFYTANISNIPSGLYFLNIQMDQESNGTNNVTFQIIIQ